MAYQYDSTNFFLLEVTLSFTKGKRPTSSPLHPLSGVGVPWAHWVANTFLRCLASGPLSGHTPHLAHLRNFPRLGGENPSFAVSLFGLLRGPLPLFPKTHHTKAINPPLICFLLWPFFFLSADPLSFSSSITFSEQGRFFKYFYLSLMLFSILIGTLTNRLCKRTKEPKNARS